MPHEAHKPVKAVLTTNKIIETLDELEGARVVEIAERVDRSQSVVHNHLSTLRELEYVVKSGKEYQLTLRFLGLGERVRHRIPLYEAAHPEVQKLAQQTGELITLLVEEHGQGIYLDIGQGSKDIQYPAIPGVRTHLHCSAVGKVILAHLSEEERETILQTHGLPEQTPQTITDRDSLDDELEIIRDQDLAFDREEFRTGLKSVGAPITGQNGEVLGALSIAGPANRMAVDRLEGELAAELRQSINVIELNVNEPNVR
ncbi:IclR family transcriptional regulator [Haloarcula brevis]|uniref:IclR family transcriptional regulator n=1 Tax=Haloarcula brevis TaxID=3111453 RepID=UPI00300F46D2